jgi:hypothetical protein
LIRAKVTGSSRSKDTITLTLATRRRICCEERFARAIENFRLGITKNRKRRVTSDSSNIAVAAL